MTGHTWPVLAWGTAGGGRRLTHHGVGVQLWSSGVVTRRPMLTVDHCPVAGPGRPLGEGIGPAGPGASTERAQVQR